MMTTRASYAQDLKRVYYLSMEFLIGRTFTNALLAVDLYDTVREALADFGVDMDALAEREPDAALGNGGLGRLAACFLDSMATLGVPGMGYGIRYEYGMFRQRIVDGQQVETPDYWLTRGNPWEFQRPEVNYRVRFGGHVQKREGTNAPYGAADWVDTHDVLAVAYDTIIPGYGTQATNTLRLWSARATEEIDLSAFNRGNYMGAVESKNQSENVSRVLYPDDSTPSGRELRLHQEYFFCSASVQDLLRRYLRNHKTFDQLSEKVSIHLNDTHPVLAVPELDAPLARRTRPRVGRGLGAHAEGVQLHQPHADARGAGDLAGRDAGAHPAAAPADHLRHQREIPGHRDAEGRQRCGAAAPAVAGRRGRRAARAHGLRGGAGQPLDQRRVGAALGADEAVDLRRLQRRSFPSASTTRPTASRRAAGWRRPTRRWRRCSTSASARAGGATCRSSRHSSPWPRSRPSCAHSAMPSARTSCGWPTGSSST